MSHWSDNFNTYQDACDFYGCDGPAQLHSELQLQAAQGSIDTQDWMEAHGRPYPQYIYRDVEF